MYIAIIYLALARLCKLFTKDIQIHSIVHCVTAFMFSTCAFIVLGINPFSFSVYDQFALVDFKIFDVIIYHSLGYFIADTIDILIDYKNVKRRIYLIHHAAAIIGLFFGGYTAVYPIWILEMGGIVHHMKHTSEVYHFEHDHTIQITYHAVYLFSRVLLSINVYNFMNSDNLFITIVITVLLGQNFVWWLHNLKRSIKLSQT